MLMTLGASEVFCVVYRRYGNIVCFHDDESGGVGAVAAILQGPSFVVAWWWVSSTLLAAGLHGMSCGCLWLENLGCSFDALGTTSTFGCCFRHVDCCVGGYG